MTAVMRAYYFSHLRQQFLTELKDLGWRRVILVAIVAAVTLGVRVHYENLPVDLLKLVLYLAPHILLVLLLPAWALLKAPAVLDHELRSKIPDRIIKPTDLDIRFHGYGPLVKKVERWERKEKNLR